MLESEAMKRVIALAAIYPNAKTTPEMFEGYASLLKDLEPDVLNAACEMAVRESESFFPSVGMILRLAQTITQPTQISEADAWGQVMDAIKKIGFYGQPKFDDPVVARAVEIMDWPTLCSSENVVADRAHFMKIYGQLAEREKEDVKLLPAARRIRELTNGKHQRLIAG